MAASLLKNEVPNLETIETLAIFRGLQLCARQGIPKINCGEWLLIDYRGAATAGRLSLPWVTWIMHDIKELMSTFSECKLQFTNRMRNGAAHRLARHVWNVNHIIIWGVEIHHDFSWPKLLGLINTTCDELSIFYNYECKSGYQIIIIKKCSCMGSCLFILNSPI